MYIDIISDEMNKNVKKDVIKNNLPVRIVTQLSDVEIIDFIEDTKSDYILFINKNDKISSNFVSNMIFTRENLGVNVDSKIISNDNNHVLQTNGKLLQTSALQNYLISNKILRFNLAEMYLFLYENSQMCLNLPNVNFSENKYIKFKKAEQDFLFSIKKLLLLEQYLKVNNKYNEDEFKKIFIDEIIFRYKQYRNSQSLLLKPIHGNEYMLKYIYTLVQKKFNDTLDFEEQILKSDDSNLKFDLSLINPTVNEYKTKKYVFKNSHND